MNDIIVFIKNKDEFIELNGLKSFNRDLLNDFSESKHMGRITFGPGDFVIVRAAGNKFEFYPGEPYLRPIKYISFDEYKLLHAVSNQ